MRIGVDIDGVLNNISDWHLSYGSKYASLKGIDRGFHPDEYFVKDVFSFTDRERNEFWDQHMVKLAKTIDIRPFAVEVLHKLKEMGHTIVILTARNSDFLIGEYEGKMDDLVLEWLDKHGVPYDEIITDSTSKVSKCLEYSLDVMIEDKKKNILEISKHIPVLCFDQLHNRGVEGHNIHRVYTWYQVYDYFCSLDEEIEII